jgi:hypothetical protein
LAYPTIKAFRQPSLLTWLWALGIATCIADRAFHTLRLARAAFWTLCVCAYALALWCTLVLQFDMHLLPFNPVIHSWPKEADFTSELCVLTSLALIPFLIHFQYSRTCVIFGLGIWYFQLFWFFAYPVY